MPTGTIVTGAVALAAALATTWLLWQIVHVILVVFAGILLAVIWWNLGQFLAALPGISARAGTAVVILLTFLAVAGLVWAVGPLLAGQLDQLVEDVTRATANLEEEVRRFGWGRWLLDDALPSLGSGGGSDLVSRITGAFTTVFGFLANMVFILLIGIYTAVVPGSYRAGVLKLIPRRHRPRAEDVLHGLGQGLWHWLLGQLVAMVAVGMTTMLGLWLIGIPLAGVLGAIAGLLNFVPLLGPILSAIPAVLVAFSQSPMDAFYVVLLFIVIQQLEGDVLTPLVQQRAVHLPPALVLAGLIVFGVLFGLMGILLATPLLVVVVVLVKMLYIENVLGEDADDPP